MDCPFRSQVGQEGAECVVLHVEPPGPLGVLHLLSVCKGGFQLLESVLMLDDLDFQILNPLGEIL